MNIFYLNEDPRVAAKEHCDKHVCKMTIEYCQLLSTAHRALDGAEYYDKTKNGRKIKRWLLPDEREVGLMLGIMLNHPSTIWMRQSLGNWLWCIEHLESMLNNYTHTYDRIHMVEKHWDKMSDDVYAFLLEEYNADEN